MSLYEEMKEEKAVSYKEREEDECGELRRSFCETEPPKPMHVVFVSEQAQAQPQPRQKQKQKQHPTEQENDDNKNNTIPMIQNREEEATANELSELRKRLDHLRKRRRRIQQSIGTGCNHQRELLLQRLNTRRRERDRIVDDYAGLWKQRDSLALFLDRAKRWNVLNDCFHIWIDGKNAFATINGCRFGAEAIHSPSCLSVAARYQWWECNNNHNNNNGSGSKWVSNAASNYNNNNATTPSDANSSNNSNNSPPRRRIILGFFGGTENTAFSSNFSSEPSPTRIPENLEPIRVPWLEVNAALGHACLLLKILQESFAKKGGIGMKFTHELHPMGATSKIGIRFGSPASATGVLAAAAGFGSLFGSTSDTVEVSAPSPASPPVIYNLFFEEASGFSFFKNNARNFNRALQAFLQCVAEAAAQQADKTIAIPHAIHHNKTTVSGAPGGASNNNDNHLNGGEWTIGGLSICYSPSPQQQFAAVGEVGSRMAAAARNTSSTQQATNSGALEWTRACKYLLTDLKWLVAYVAKHVDR